MERGHKVVRKLTVAYTMSIGAAVVTSDGRLCLLLLPLLGTSLGQMSHLTAVIAAPESAVNYVTSIFEPVQNLFAA